MPRFSYCNPLAWFVRLATLIFQKKLLAGNAVDEFIDLVRDQIIKEVGGKLASENSISLDGHPGREIKVHIFRGELRMRMFLAGDRMYTLSIFTMEKVDEETFNRFFSSFKLSPIAKPIAALTLR